MKTFVINGKFFSDRMQGIVRYGRELLGALDKNLTDGCVKLILALPQNAVDVPVYNNISVIKIGNRTGIKWEQIDLASFMRKHKEYLLINFCNTTPFFIQPGITTVHDIMYKTFPQNYITLRNKISRIWHCIQYKYIFKHERIILTVSEFSKKEIERNYPKTRGKIYVIPNGWQHVNEYKENKNWEKDYPDLKKNDYFFSLATLANNKNVKWIIEVAKRNPKFTFVIAGKIYDAKFNDIPENVKLLGFVSDEDACSLIKNCKAFIFPSIYEGFGIPPLEALALGANVISSNASCLPEVLGDSVNYFDPHNYEYNCNFDNLVTPNRNALDKYSWDKSAIQLNNILVNYI